MKKYRLKKQIDERKMNKVSNNWSKLKLEKIKNGRNLYPPKKLTEMTTQMT